MIVFIVEAKEIGILRPLKQCIYVQAARCNEHEKKALLAEQAVNGRDKGSVGERRTAVKLRREIECDRR